MGWVWDGEMSPGKKSDVDDDGPEPSRCCKVRKEGKKLVTYDQELSQSFTH